MIGGPGANAPADVRRGGFPVPGFPFGADGQRHMCPKCVTGWVLIALAFVAAVMLYRRKRGY
jgi:hypothetical protein